MTTGNYNNKLQIILLTVLLWLSGRSVTFPQDYLFDVETINVEDGLPHRIAYNVVQDKEGFIWVSTLAGISRYDGYQFKTYDNPDLHISENNVAQQLLIDASNRLWYVTSRFGTPPHIGVIDINSDSIYTTEAIYGEKFTSGNIAYIGISKVDGSDMIIATRNGIVYSYDGDIKEIYRSPYAFSEKIACEALPDGSYWVVNRNEVIRVKNGKRLQLIKVNYEIERIVAAYPDLILEISDSYINVAGKYRKLENDALIPFSFPGHSSGSTGGILHSYQNFNCYVTENELLILDKQGNILYTLDQLRSSGENQSLPEIQNIFLDRQGILWVTTTNGLLKISVRKNPFKLVGPKASIRGIYRSKKQLWIGAQGKNVIENIGSGERQEFWSSPSHAATSFCEGEQGELWIGTSIYVLINYIPDTDTYIHYDFDPSLSLHQVFRNAVTKTYWIGTNNGLFRFNEITKKITLFPLPVASEGMYIRQFYQNAAGIWIVSDKGIFLMDAEKETILKHYSEADDLPANNINHLHEDAKGIFWLGTKGDGLFRWNLRTNSFRQYTRNDGLSNNNIYAVYEDDYETLWLPSDYGLMAFDKNTETTRIYLPQQGIAHEEFNTHSHLQDQDGTLYFGGLNGITKFHPSALRQENVVTPPLYATKVRVLEKDAAEFADNTSLYTDTKKITLNPNDRILELELTLLDYEKSAENQYAYKLTGHQEQWIYTTGNKLSVINPPYGRYDLVVKARGASGQWSEKPLTIPMNVRPPFYLQWWFILTTIAILIVGVLAIIRRRTRKLRKDRERLENEVQKRTQKIAEQAEDLKALDRAKSRFFTNITHEFRTPLTLIGGPVEQIIAADIPPFLKAQAKIVKSNAKHLTGLIDQLLDISRLESGQMEIKTSTTDIVVFTRELVQVFSSLADEKKQKLIYHPAIAAWETRFDTEKYSEIAYNLLSNALKYSPEKAIVELLLSKDNDADKEYIKIVVKDNGTGIAEEALPYIFDRFYQVDDSATRRGKGTGIGLALVRELVTLMNGEITVASEVGKGTVFTVRLPVLSYAEQSEASVEVSSLRIPPVWQETGVLPGEKQVSGISGENKLELLIIEDHTEMRSYIRSCIDPSLYNITEAADGAEGIEKALELIPDLIISDVMMPEKDGFEVTFAIRNHTATSHIPLILLTAKASDESRLKGISRGADVYLTKPFSPEELVLRVKKLIEIRQLLQKRFQGDKDREVSEENTGYEKEDRFISELRNYINDHIPEPNLSVETISSHFAISRRQLNRKMRALINTSANHYIQSLRMEKAMQLLKEKQLNITEVAYATGFSSLSYFSKTFKKTYGKNPSEVL